MEDIKGISEFMTIAFLSTWAGIIAVIMLLTQFCKDLWDTKVAKTRTKYVVLAISFILLILVRFFAGVFFVSAPTFAMVVFEILKQIFLTFLDSFAVTVVATTGYDYLLKSPNLINKTNAVDETVQTQPKQP